MCQHTPDSLHDGLVHSLGHAIQFWHLRHGVFEPNSHQPIVFFKLPSVFSSIVRSNRFQLPIGFTFHSLMEFLEDGQYLVLCL